MQGSRLDEEGSRELVDGLKGGLKEIRFDKVYLSEDQKKKRK